MLVRQLIELVTPTTCLQCGRDGDVVCAGCVASLPNRPEVCYRCNRLSVKNRTCAGCRRSSRLGYVTVGAYYDGFVKELVLKLKFDRSMAAGSSAAAIVLRHEVADCDIVTAVPVSPRRRRERGYNQSEIIARAVAKRLGKPYRETLLRASTTHQLGLGREDRFKEIQGAFSPLRALSGERVLIIDDVLTTGATLEECARVIQEAGAKQISAAVVARHRA